MPGVTVRDLIRDALLDIGVISEDEAPTAVMAAGALRKFNQMVETWNVDGRTLYGTKANVLPFQPNKGVYSVGPGGDLDIPYPEEIFSVSVRQNGNPLENTVDYPIQLLSPEQWAMTAYKQNVYNFPFMGVFIDQTFPLLTVYTNPIPMGDEYSLILWTKEKIGVYTLDQLILLPPGYERALTSNLSIELAPSYDADVSEITLKIARTSKAAITQKNRVVNELKTGRGTQYDIVSNGYI